MADLVRMGDQFSGLDMGALIGGPLKAACEAQSMLANSQLNFIEQIGLCSDDNGKTTKVRTTSFSFTRSAASEITDEKGVAKPQTEYVEMNIPLLAIVNVPSLAIDKVNITFDMEVKSSTSSESTKDTSGDMSVTTGGKFGGFHFDVSIKGSVSCHDKNTRSSDNSAKYHVEVTASQQPTPEGLSRMIDILNTAITPTKVEKKDTESAKSGGSTTEQ